MFPELATSNTWLKDYQLNGDLLRRILIASCLTIYFVRLQVTVWIFQKRKWTWLETITITVLMSFVLYAYASVGGNNKQVLGVVEVIGILLYFSGSYINTHSEYYRHVWKLINDNYYFPSTTIKIPEFTTLWAKVFPKSACTSFSNSTPPSSLSLPGETEGTQRAT